MTESLHSSLVSKTKKKPTAGESICLALKAHGYTIRGFARKVHVHASTVSRWCSGERGPSRKYMPILRDELGLDVNLLV